MHTNIRNSHVEVFCKMGVLKNFAKFTEKYLLRNINCFSSVLWTCLVHVLLDLFLANFKKRFHMPRYTFKQNNEKVFPVKISKVTGEHLLWRTSTNGYLWKGGTDILLMKFQSFTIGIWMEFLHFLPVNFLLGFLC